MTGAIVGERLKILNFTGQCLDFRLEVGYVVSGYLGEEFSYG